MSRLPLADRIAAVDAAAEAGTGRLDGTLIDRARATADRARERAGLSAEHTVVALAGATGSGKSSVFNALVGSPLSTVGVQRPTTSHPSAAVWSGQSAGEAGPLLDWLEVRRRHDVLPSAKTPTGLVLLDLPDHDSVVTEHRIRAERLVQRADLLVWVVDPQKYADAALHEQFLRPLAGHGDVTVVVLNQIDRLTPEDARACVRDLRRLVAQDGLSNARVLPVSARTGEGLDDLRAIVTDAAVRREAANARSAADLRDIAREIIAECGSHPARRRDCGALIDALEAAAGVPVVVSAVRRSGVRDARTATGWPVTRWLARFRPDPLRRIGLRSREAAKESELRADLARTSLPAPTPAVRAAALAAVRDYVWMVTADAPEAFVLAARDRAAEGAEGLAEALDHAVAGSVLTVGRRPIWWRAVGFVQWVLFAAMVAGLLWLAVIALLAYFKLPDPPMPLWGEVPVPTALAVGGALAGILVALIARLFAEVGGRRRGRQARRTLRRAVTEVADRLVRQPVGAELDALRTCREAAQRAAA